MVDDMRVYIANLGKYGLKDVPDRQIKLLYCEAISFLNGLHPDGRFVWIRDNCFVCTENALLNCFSGETMNIAEFISMFIGNWGPSDEK